MEPPIFTIKANGKLLLTGEYFVLDGAKALAVPARFGQQLDVFLADADLRWESYDVNGRMWFSARYSLTDFSVLETNDRATASALQGVLQVARGVNPEFLSSSKGCLAKIYLEFPNNWGLGSSSTLLYCVAEWAKVDAFALSNETFGGSGYDIACAGADRPIFYRKEGLKPIIEVIEYKPSFYQQLSFIHLGKKQNSRLGIQRYREKAKDNSFLLEKISQLSEEFYQAESLHALEYLIQEHEKIVAETLELDRAKSLYFNDYWGEVKSLGAWGGDFVLVTNNRSLGEMKSYFTKKGFKTILSFEEMVLMNLNKTFAQKDIPI